MKSSSHNEWIPINIDHHRRLPATENDVDQYLDTKKKATQVERQQFDHNHNNKNNFPFFFLGK